LKTIIVQIRPPVALPDQLPPPSPAAIDRQLPVSQPEPAPNRPDAGVRQTVDQLNLIGVTIDADGTLLHANPYTCRVTAWLPDEVTGRNFFDLFVPPADRARLEQELDEATRRGGFAEPREIELLARSGAKRQVQVNSFLVHRTAGAVDSFTLIGEDLTNKKRCHNPTPSCRIWSITPRT
jgi:PAS domain S-box-containing protein